MSLNSLFLHQGPNRLALITSLSHSFEELKENSFSPFRAKELPLRVKLVADATKACHEFLGSYFSKEPILFKPSYKKPLSDEPLASTKIYEALDLELPFLNSKSEFSIDEELYLKLKTPKNDLQAKALGLKVTRFATSFLNCLRCHSTTYRGIKQITADLNVPGEFDLYLPRKASFFNAKILHGDEACSYSEPFARGSSALLRKFEHHGAVFAKKEYTNYQTPQMRVQFFHEIGANLVLPPCKEILTLEAVFPNGLILEYTDRKTLLEVRDSEKLLTQKAIKQYLFTLASALDNIHSRGFVHTDVKPNNVLCFGESEVKLGDLGYMKPVGSKHEWISSPFSTPPEKFLKGAEIEPSGDIWALGALAFSILTKKRTPFSSDDIRTLAEYQLILLEKNYNKEVSTESLKALLNEHHLFNLSTQDPDGSILSLVAQCMSGHIHRRPTAKQLKARLLKEIEA